MLKKLKAKEETETEVEAVNVEIVVVTEKDVMAGLEVTDVQTEEVLVTEATEVTEEALIEEVLMVQDQDVLKDLDLVIPVLETEVKEADRIIQGRDVLLLLAIREVLKDQDPEGQIQILVQEVQTDQGAQDVKLFC